VKQQVDGYPTLWLFNIAMENDPFIDGLPIKKGVIKLSHVGVDVQTRSIPMSTLND